MRLLLVVGGVLTSAAGFACENAMEANDLEQPSSEVFALRASQELRHGNYRGAVSDSGRVLIDPQAPAGAKRDARVILGTAQVRLEQFTAGRETLLKALEQQPTSAVIIGPLGEAEEGLGHHAEAKKYLEPLVAQDRVPSGEAYLALARARLALGDRPGAIEACDQAMRQVRSHDAAAALKADIEKLSAPAPASAKRPSPSRT